MLAAQAGDGRFHNRRATDLSWQDQPSIEDCWGRALWGLGAAVASPVESAQRDAALAAFDRGARWRSPWSRAMAFAALGAAEVLRVLPGHSGARELIAAAATMIGRPMVANAVDQTAPVRSGEMADQIPPTDGWLWPEPRLAYANAALPEALLAAGAALDDPSLVADGLTLLGWLLDAETRGGHLSVVPVGGRGPSGTARPAAPGFDQQPIEVAALADACARAYEVTGHRRWAEGIDLAAAWFLGANDSSTPLYDADSGGGCDGLERDGRNENQGAESTLALVSTLQQARWLSLCSR